MFERGWFDWRLRPWHSGWFWSWSSSSRFRRTFSHPMPRPMKESVGRSAITGPAKALPRRRSERGGVPVTTTLNAVFYSAFGDSRLALVVLNIFAGVWTALFTFYLTREFLPVASAKVAAILTAVFPSIVLWSVLNIRDALAALCTVVLVLYGMRLSKRLRLSHLWIFAAALLGLGLLRDYMAFLVVLGLAIGSVTAIRPERMFGTMLFGTTAALALTYFADQVGLFSAISPEGLLETAQVLRTGLQQGAVSAFGVGAQTGTIGEALQYIPIGAPIYFSRPSRGMCKPRFRRRRCGRRSSGILFF